MSIYDERVYTVGYLFNDEGTEVALIKKTHPAAQAGLYNGIGGLVKPFEEGQRCMVREFAEETGLITPIDLWQKTIYLQGIGWQVFYHRAFSTRFIEKLRSTTKWPTDEHVSIWPVAALPMDKLYNHVAWTLHVSAARNIKFYFRVDDVNQADYICPMCLDTYDKAEHSICPHCGYGHP